MQVIDYYSNIDKPSAAADTKVKSTNLTLDKARSLKAP
jgi:hypothetical protein